MDTLPRSFWSKYVGWIAIFFVPFSATVSATSTITVRPQRVVPNIRAFARVSPMTYAMLRAASEGRLDDLDVVPGSMLRAGQRIGKLGGSRIQARLARDRALLDAAHDTEEERRDALAIQRANLAKHLSTRKDVDQAIGALAQARAQSVAAFEQLRTDRSLTVLKAPATGTVIAVMTHVGERVRAGQALVRIQPNDALRLFAEVYAPDVRRRLHIGMPGQFVPADGSATLRVRVTQIPPRVHADGGQSVIMVRAAHTSMDGWVSGEAGTVYLEGTPEQRILVPTHALILDRGHWWVLLRTSRGERRRSVTPGAREGDRTVILKGLKPGMAVIVDHAYRRFHRDIAHSYQVQD